MKNKTKKILLLSDLNSATDKMLKTTVCLAKIIHGEIEIFNVKKPTEIVDIDNQLSAMRSINTEYSVIDKKLKKQIEAISKDSEIDITYSFAFGNPKNEIRKYIEEHRPDIVVVGKRNYKSLNVVGDNITGFVLNAFHGPILISSDKRALEPEVKLSLGVLNGLKPSSKVEFSEDLMAHVQSPIRSFKFVMNSEALKINEDSRDKEIREYAFEYNSKTIEGLPKYVAKNDVDLLYVNRKNKGQDDGTGLKKSDIKNIIKQSDISVLVSNVH